MYQTLSIYHLYATFSIIVLIRVADTDDSHHSSLMGARALPHSLCVYKTALQGICLGAGETEALRRPQVFVQSHGA